MRAVLGAGMYPLVGSVVPAAQQGGSGGGGRGAGKVTLSTLRGEKVKVHPSSLAGPRGSDSNNGFGGFGGGGGGAQDGAPPTIMAFEEMVRGDATTCAGISLDYPRYPLMIPRIP